MKEISPESIKDNPFSLIGDDWMLITAEKDSKVNMMTASWGSFGVFWNKPTATVYIRQSRYTKEFIDAEERFSLCVLPEELKKAVHGVCGSQSGRNIDKLKATNLTVEHENGVPYFKESKMVFICKKIYAQKMEKSAFMEEEPFNKNYTNGDLHTMYIAEIEKILTK